MINLYFDDPFPNINILQYLGLNSFSTPISSESRIIDCFFFYHMNGPIINAINNIQKFHIDKTSFIKCQGTSSGGAILLDMTGTSSLVVISRSCAVDCQCGATCEGNFARITLNITETGYGKCILSMTSINQCQKSEKNSYHSVTIKFGVQEILNLNNTNCKNFRNSGFSNFKTQYECAKYCNLEWNEVAQTLLLWPSGYNIYRYMNIIRNMCGQTTTAYKSLILNEYSKSYFSLESSYVVGNTCQYLFQNSGTMSVRGCSLDYKTSTGNSISFLNEVKNEEYKMTLLASCEIHAIILYHENTKNPINHRRLSVFLFPLWANLSKNQL